MTADTTTARFEAADIPTLRRALLADAEAHYERHRRFYRADEEPRVGDQSGNPYLAAWSALAVASSQAQMIAALLGIAQRDPGMSDAGRTEMTRLVGQVLDGWPEVLEGANDDVDVPDSQIPGQQETPAPGESLLESVRRELLVGPHAAPGEDAPTHPGPGESCQDPACVKSRRQHEAAAELQRITFEILGDGPYEADADPEQKLGDHGTCSAPVGRGAEGTGTCGYGIVLREERTALMADGTDGHGQPGGQLVLVWRHADPAIDHHHRAQLGGPA